MAILKRFQMLNCKPLATPMVPNLKLSADLYSDLVDPSVESFDWFPNASFEYI